MLSETGPMIMTATLDELDGLVVVRKYRLLGCG
jgi:hypothetical protein